MIRVSKRDLDFMLRVLQLPPGLAHRVKVARVGDGRLGDDDADSLRDMCSDRLQTHGFGPDYEPTEEGRRLEALIDKLLVG